MDKELTFEQVRDGIIMALKHAYPDCNVRSDYTPQNVSDGDFNVIFVTSQTPEHVGDYWKHSVTLILMSLPLAPLYFAVANVESAFSAPDAGKR